MEPLRTRPIGDFRRAPEQAQVALWLLLAAGLLMAVLLWLSLSGRGTQAPLAADGASTATLDDGPEAAAFDGPVAPKLGPGEDLSYHGPPDRVYQSRGASQGTVRGRVVAEGWVLWPAGVELRLEKQGSPEVLQSLGVQESQPNFEFEPVPFGNYRLRLVANDYLEQSLLLTLSQESPDQHLAVPLIPAGKLLGRVQDTLGQAVGGIPVVALRRPDKPGFRSVPYRGVSAADGNYLLRGLEPGTYDVMAGSEFQPLGEAKVTYLKDQAAEAWVELEIPPVGRAAITLDFRSGEEAMAKDLPLVKVEAQGSDASNQGFQFSLSPDADGVVHFPALPPGQFAFTAYGGPYRRTLRHGTVIAGQELALTIPLSRPGETAPR